MPKTVSVEIVFDYDPDHDNDLLDVVRVSQVTSTLTNDEAHEQAMFLLNDTPWLEALGVAVADAIVGATTHFGSDEN